MSLMHVIIRTDGGSRGNPGPSGCGAVVEDGHGKVLREVSKYIGTATNNIAEYRAVLFGLRAAKELGATSAEVVADSELMIKQANRIYKVKHPNLRPLYEEMLGLAQAIGKVTYRHVRREQNAAADDLANQAMDRKA